MSAEGSKVTEVEIYGAVYRVRGGEDSEYLQELASFVDRRMQEIAEQAKVLDRGKLAVLAALNLADELFQCRNGQEGERVEIREKVEELTGKLAKALAG